MSTSVTRSFVAGRGVNWRLPLAFAAAAVAFILVCEPRLAVAQISWRGCCDGREPRLGRRRHGDRSQFHVRGQPCFGERQL